MIYYFLFIFLLVQVYGDNATVSRVVNTAQGPVKGYILPEGIFGFFSIPYATVPKGKDRFKAPLPPPIFNETFEAVEHMIFCPQTFMPDDDGNCLITNIFTPNTNDTNLSVLVFVHGGGFQTGSAFGRRPTNLVRSKNVIVAMFNYRVGPHGFLCLGTENIPGNAGLKDQVALLRWMHKNIASFGGNPNDITIYGYSAGARSVDLLLLSKATSNLIKGVIADSGSGLGKSSVQIDPLQNAKTYARMLNFTNVDDINALEHFYLTTPFETLTSIFLMIMQDYLLSPCVERYVGEEIFLHDSPLNILKSGDYPKIPILLGYTEAEGSFRLGLFPDWKDQMNQNLSNFLPHDLHFPTEREREDVVNRVKAFYFKNQEISEENILYYINYFGDIMYIYPTIRSVKLHAQAKHNNVFLYEYSFVSEESPTIPHINKRAAFHSIQTVAIFDERNEENHSAEYKNMKIIMRDLWHNFMANKQPVGQNSSYPPWLPVRLNNTLYMSLNHTLEMRSLQHRALFWEDIYEKYYRNPVPPPAYNSSNPENTLSRLYYLAVLLIAAKLV